MNDSVLFVDDEQNVLSALERTFRDEPYRVFTAQGSDEGFRVLSLNNISVVISDERMPGMSGADFLSAVKKDYPECVRILLTGHANIASTLKAVNDGEIYRFMLKPWNDEELKFAVRSSVEKSGLERENRALLKQIKQQSVNMKLLEKQFPNITKVERDSEGCIILPDISQGDVDRIVQQVEDAFN